MQVQQAATVKTLAGLHMPRMIYGTAWKKERTGVASMLIGMFSREATAATKAVVFSPLLSDSLS
jgi:hypothetical protein